MAGKYGKGHLSCRSKTGPGWSLKLDLESHPDNVGSDDYNQRLSEPRGEAVRSDAPQARQQNRRVEPVISGEVIGTEIGMPIAAR